MWLTRIGVRECVSVGAGTPADLQGQFLSHVA
jgi:hypothetical protein